MSRARRFVLGLALAGAAAGAGFLAWVSAVGTPAALDALPAGADAVVELRGVEPLARRLSGTRFAAAFARSGTRAWLERSDAVAALDAARAAIGRVAGFTPGRGIAFDVLGAEAAIGWYPAARGPAGSPPWAAAGRMSVRAWAVSAASRLARAAGAGATLVGSERVDGRTLYTVRGGGQPLHVLFAGRVVVASSDVELARLAARAAADPAGSVGRSPQLQAARAALPARGELFAWFRDPGRLVGGSRADAAAGAPAALSLRAGGTVEIDVAAAAPAAAGDDGRGAAAPLPGIALLDREPLLFLSSREPAPPALRALLAERQRSVAALRAAGAAAVPVPVAGRGYAVVVTGAGEGSGLFPAPRGLVMIGMADAAAAAEALRLAFPPGAPAAPVGAARVLTSRESFPLAGEFDLAGAAVGPHVVFATDAALIAAAATAAPPAAPGAADPSWRVVSIASVSMAKALPLLQRWAAPLSGLVGARWPGAPEIAGDLDLLAAIRTLRVVAGADGRFRRAAITLNVRDLP